MLNISQLRTPLVGPVDLTVDRGECVAILGPSGSGKSLLLRAIVDLDPNQGTVRLGDRDRERMPADRWRRLVALVPAESGWWADRVGAHFDDGAEARRLLDAVGLPQAADWQVARLSTGERQRLALVRALCGAPEALLLDEPTAALDEAASAQVEALLRERCQRGMALVIVTHDRAQAKRLAARRYEMRDGRLRPLAEAAA